ncbi:DUF2357 domain-containing protein [Pyxidicoccus xibeiensis]|uniref:DUF2357 domain-containing protein n=1 Tax=Pyxidicoccus xibeiensis TaxID=2906759 RepID=UPI0020A7064A|nr:DUF2357 domain-containing protein [Pyxidicoccus xibeiensis]MCP3143103.1 restriction endonuclease-like protein [Pyxidicoccus xibeiensis]
MQLRLEGSDIVVEQVGGAFRLEEARRYELVLAATEQVEWVRFGGHELPRAVAANTFLLDVRHWGLAKQTLELKRIASQVVELQVEVIPRRDKLGEEQWLRLLSDLEQWLPALTTGLEGGLGGAVGAQGASAPFLALALLPLVSHLQAAVRQVVSAPRETLTEQHEEVRPRAVRRAQRDTVRWLASHPLAASAVLDSRPGMREPFVPRTRGEVSIDHPVNRYVRYLVREVTRRFDLLAERLDTHARAQEVVTDAPVWCQRRAERCRNAARSLRAVVSQGAFGKLVAEPPGEAAVLAVQDDPAYARVHRLGRLMLSPRFQLAQGPQGAPVRPSYELYELWTLLTLARGLQARFPQAPMKWRGLHALESGAALGTDGVSAWMDLPEGTLGLYFNATFRSYFARGSATRWSLSMERRPDLVVTWAPREGDARWMVLDAKYRVSRTALSQALTSAHLYRDSLLWPEFGGRCGSALMVVPSVLEEVRPWADPGFIGEYGFGLVQATPGAVSASTLGDRVCDALKVT